MTSVWLPVILIALLKFSIQAAGAPNDTVISSTMGVTYNFTVTTNIPVTITAFTPTLDYIVIPNGIGIEPTATGRATVLFMVRGLDATLIPARLRVVVMVPTTTFMGIPITGPTSKITKFGPQQHIAISGVSRMITRTFFGFSVQTFAQLTGVIIANAYTITTANVTRTNYTKFDGFSIPTLM